MEYSCVVVCDTAKVRFFKQITTVSTPFKVNCMLFAILQKYDFSSKSQQELYARCFDGSCLRYCKSTIFQANHNCFNTLRSFCSLFAILQKYDFSSKSQLNGPVDAFGSKLFAILQKYDFSSKSQLWRLMERL